MQDSITTRTELNELFADNSQVVVTFTKKDGSNRVMRCTRKYELIPAEHYPKNYNPDQDPGSIFKVFDLDKEGWRCFDLNSIIEVTPTK